MSIKDREEKYLELVDYYIDTCKERMLKQDFNSIDTVIKLIDKILEVRETVITGASSKDNRKENCR